MDERKIAYFKEGMLYDVSPRDESLSLYEDRQTAYDATVIVSDGVEYDINTIEGIEALPMPDFPVTNNILELSYIMKLHCGGVKDVKILPTIIDKTIQLMLASKMGWMKKDFLQIIHYCDKFGIEHEGERIEQKYCARYPEEFGDRDEYLKRKAQEASLRMGDELGYDAVEITAFNLCCPEHEPLQGKVFLLAEFEKMQTGRAFEDVDGKHYAAITQPIGSRGCMHFAMSFSTKYSFRKYTDKQLQQFAEMNHRTCNIGGKIFTRWEAHELMMDIEADIRSQKQKAIVAMRCEDEDTRRDCQIKINSMTKQYYEIVEGSGLRSHMDRTCVYGFKRIKL